MSTTGGFLAGSIVAKLLLDRQGWSDSVSAVKDDVKGLSLSAKGISDTFGSLATTLTGFGIAMAGAIGGLALKTADYEHEIGHLSEKTGIAVETLSGLKLAADKGDISLEGLAMAFGICSKQMVMAEEAGKKNTVGLAALGISMHDVNGKLKDSETILYEVADAFVGMKNGPEKAGIAMEIFGRSGRDMIPILNEGSAGLKAEKDRATELGMVLTTEGVQKALDFKDATIELTDATAAAGRSIGEALTPVVKDLAEKVTTVAASFTAWAKAHPELISQIGEIILKAGVLLIGLGAVAKAISVVATIFPVAAGAAKFLVTAFTGLLSPIGLVVAAAGVMAIILLKVQAAEDYAAEAGKRCADMQDNLGRKLADAAAKAGIHGQAFQDLIDKYHGNYTAMAMAIEKGEEDKKLQVGLAEVGKAHAAVIEDQKNKLKTLVDVGLKPTITAADKLKDLFSELGVTTKEEVSKKLADAALVLKDFGDKLPAEGIQKLNEDMLKWKETLGILDPMEKAQLDNSKAWKDVLQATPEKIEDVTVAYGGLDEELRAYAIQTGLSYDAAYTAAGGFKDQILDVALKMHTTAEDVVNDIIRMEIEMLRLAGIEVPNPFKDLPEQARKSTADVKRPFDTLWSDIAKGFGDTFKKWAEGGVTFKNFLTGLWGDIKTAFFDFVGSLVTEWIETFLKKALVQSTASAAATAGASMTSMGGAVASVATTIGTVITTLATAVATAITTIAGGIGTALVSIATAVASACTVLAAAAAAIVTVGIMAIALYAAFKLVGGIVSAIFGGGGGGGKDVTRWLELIHENTQEIYNTLFNDTRKQLGDLVGATQAWMRPIQDGYNKLVSIEHYSTWLPKIYQELIGIYNNTASGAQEGMLAMEPTFRKIGEQAPRIPEIVAPLPKFQSMVASAAARQGPASVPVTVIIDGREVRLETGLKPLLIRVMPEWSADGILQFNVAGLRTAR